MLATRAFIVQLYGKFSLTLTVGQYKRKLVEQFLRILQSMGFCSVYVRLRMQCHTNFLPYVRKWGCRVSYNERWVENEAYQQINFLVLQSVDKQLVVLEQGSCDKLRTQEVGSKDAVLLVGHVPQRSVYCMDFRPLLIFTSWANMIPTARHRTYDKKCTDQYDPLTGNLDPSSWRKSLHTFYIMQTNEDNRNHPHHLFSHCASDYLPGS